MSKGKELFSWIDYSNSIQCEWALRYLATRGYSYSSKISTANERLRETVKLVFEKLPDTQKLLNQQMKAAWNQKKNRSSTKDRKAYSFIMSTDIEKMLKSLARDKGKPINKVLEGLIEDAKQFNVETRATIQKELERLNKATENSWLNKKEKATKEFQSNKHELVKLAATNKFQHDFIASLLFTASEHECYFNKNNINPNNLGLTGEEQAAVMKDAADRLTFHNAKLDSTVREMGIYR